MRNQIRARHLNFVFDDHITALYQIQEMTHAKPILEESTIEHGLATYNSLIPPAGGLPATLLIEYEEARARGENLANLPVLENHFWLCVAPAALGRAN